MNTKTKFACGLAALMLPILVACTPASNVGGKVVDKYIEDFTEYTIVVEQDGTGDKYHFTIDADQWRTISINQQVSSKDLQAPEEDD